MLNNLFRFQHTQHVVYLFHSLLQLQLFLIPMIYKSQTVSISLFTVRKSKQKIESRKKFFFVKTFATKQMDWACHVEEAFFVGGENLVVLFIFKYIYIYIYMVIDKSNERSLIIPITREGPSTIWFRPTNWCSGYGSRLLRQRYRVRIPGKAWM